MWNNVEVWSFQVVTDVVSHLIKTMPKNIRSLQWRKCFSSNFNQKNKQLEQQIFSTSTTNYNGQLAMEYLAVAINTVLRKQRIVCTIFL